MSKRDDSPEALAERWLSVFFACGPKCCIFSAQRKDLKVALVQLIHDERRRAVRRICAAETETVTQEAQLPRGVRMNLQSYCSGAGTVAERATRAILAPCSR